MSILNGIATLKNRYAKFQAILMSITMGLAAATIPGQATVLPGPHTWYVSASRPPLRPGQLPDGTSLYTPWPELSAINWSQVQPGDTIEVACGIYRTPLLVQKDSVTIRCAYVAPLPGSLPPLPPPQPNCPPAVTILNSYAQMQSGIQVAGRNVSIKGPVWKSIVVTGWSAGGVIVSPSAVNTKLQNMEITYNGPTNGASSGGGLLISGAATQCSQLVVHDNRNTNISIQPGPSGPPTAFTRCLIANYQPALNPLYYVQPDGLRLQGNNTSLQIQSCIFGPGLQNGIAAINCQNTQTSLLGCLFINSIQSDLTKNPLFLATNNVFRLTNIISFHTALNIRDQASTNLNYPVTPLDSVSQSYFYGGTVFVMSNMPVPPQQRNLQYRTSGNTAYLSPAQTPFQFRSVVANLPNNVPAPVLMNMDFTPSITVNITPNSMTSVQQLFSRNIIVN